MEKDEELYHHYLNLAAESGHVIAGVKSTILYFNEGDKDSAKKMIEMIKANRFYERELHRNCKQPDKDEYRKINSILG